jgi:hypothetical protein
MNYYRSRDASTTLSMTVFNAFVEG